MIEYFFKGVDFHNPRLTRDWRIWLQYLCWCIQFALSGITWCYPMWFRVWWWKRTGKNLVYMPGKRSLQSVKQFFRYRTGDRSHRCEFTDREIGALYGGQRGGFMNELFEQFIENISDAQP